jgi:hypothetical protein
MRHGYPAEKMNAEDFSGTNGYIVKGSILERKNRA